MTSYYHTMPIDVDNYQPRRQNRRYTGGKIGVNKALSKINKANPINQAFKNKKLVNAMGDIGQFTQNKILPATVSVGIPLASTALGGLATMYGGPVAGQMVGSLSQNLMEQYIPNKYQSNNKYVGLLGDALSMGLSGDIDPLQAQSLGQQFLGNVEGDIGKLMTPKNKHIDNYYNSMNYTNNMSTRPNVNLPLPPRPPQYNPDNIYQDLMEMMQKPTEKNINKISDNSLDSNHQKQGSLSGLYGAGVKKRKSKKSKNEDEEIITKVEVVKRPRHKKFSHAKNLALDQLIEANEHRKKSDTMKKAEELIERQTRMLKAMGY